MDASASPFLVRATGSSAQVAAALHTKFSTYRSKKGVTYFQNSAPVALPSSVASYVQGVTGLTNTIRDQSQIVRPTRPSRPRPAPPRRCPRPARRPTRPSPSSSLR